MAITPTLSRLRVMKVVIEVDKGDFLAPTQAGHVYDLECDSVSEYQSREGTGLYLGPEFAGNQGEALGKSSFKTELKGNGSSGMDAFAAILLQACGLVKTGEVYSVHSSHAAQKTISIAVWENGKKKMIQGCSGNVNISGEHGKSAELTCDFSGFWVDPIDESTPAWTPATQMPILFDSGTLTVGGENAKPSRFSIDIGVTLASIGGDYFIVSNIKPVITLDACECLVAEYDWHGLKKAGTPMAVSIPLTDGTDTITIAAPAMVITELKGGEREELNILDLTGECIHSSGDDSLSITVT